MRITKLMGLILSAAVPFLPMAAHAQQEGLIPSYALIRATGTDSLNPSQIELKVNGRKMPITGLNPVMTSKAPIELVIAIDSGLRTQFATNLDSLRKFIMSLPPNVAVSVGYMQNGTVMMQRALTNEHEEASKSLQIPIGEWGASASPYFCVEDLAKRWPSTQRALRVVMMITNGIDPYNGRPTPMNQDSPYVDQATQSVQEAGVTVYSIYWGNRPLGLGFGSFSGESYLAQISQATGGDLLSSGTMDPPDIAPYLERFQKALNESYVAVFNVPAGKHMATIKMSTSVKHVKVFYPQAMNAGN